LMAYVARDCKNTEIIPTTVDITHLVPATDKAPVNPPVLGWIGSPSTWSYCLPLLELFSGFAKAAKLSALIIGANHRAEARTNFEFRDWREESEVADIQQMDIGIMPIPDEPWARGKCGYKLIQYMACCLPVIASPVGVNNTIVEHGVNGLLATTQEEWRHALDMLLVTLVLSKNRKVVTSPSMQRAIGNQAY
ncbi:MAG: glycosyltransferase family 4 protein, partial [Burkholderia sp.]|nr:glycosyltransferase family 4 protein [Burkholderia sp.]